MSRVRTEYAELQEERARVERRTARQTSMSRWFMRQPTPQPDHFTWRDPFATAPPISEIED